MTTMRLTASAAGPRPWLLALLLAVVPLWNHPYFEELKSPNPLSRSYLTRALYDHHVVNIDDVERQFGEVNDHARRDQHDYCDKAPGSSFLLLPVYALLRIGHTPAEVSHQRLLGWGSFALGVLPTVLALLCLDALLVWLSVRRAARRVALVAMGLGSVGVPFELLFFGHQTAGCLIAFTLWAGVRAVRNGRFSAAMLAGWCAGWAMITEYPATLLVCFIALLCAGLIVADGFLVRPRLSVLVGGVLVGALVPLGLAGWYHQVAFGGRLTTGYKFIDNAFFAAVHRQGLVGVSLPTWAGLGGTLFSPARGLFYFQPYLLLAPVGCAVLARRGTRWWALILLLALAVYASFAAGFGFWQGGWSLGPRHLVPSLPLWTIAFGVALGWLEDERRAWLGALARGAVAWSVVAIGLACTTHSGYPEEFAHPFFQMTVPLWMGGFFPYSVGTLAGLDRVTSAWVPITVLSGAVLFVAVAGRAMRARTVEVTRAALTAWAAVGILVAMRVLVTFPPEASHRLAWIMDTVWEPRRTDEPKRPDPVKLAPGFGMRPVRQDERNHVGRHSARIDDPQHALEEYVRGVADAEGGRP